MKKSAIKRLILTGFGSAIAVLALLGSITWYNAIRSDETSRMANVTNDVIVTLEKVKADMYRAESAQRGYALIGDKVRLIAREGALASLDNSVNDAARLVANHPNQQQRIAELRRIIASRTDVFRRYEELGNRGDRAAVNTQISLGDPLSDRLRQLIGDMEQEENLLLQRRQSAEQSVQLGTRVGGILLLLLLCGVLYTIYRLIARIIHLDQSRIALKRSEALLKQILEVLPVGVFVADSSGAITMVNPTARRIWGRAPDANLDQMDKYQMWRTDTGEKLASDQCGLSLALKTGRATAEVEYEIECFNGERKIIRNSVVPLRDLTGQIIGAIAVNTDVTSLKRTKEALQIANDRLEARVNERTMALTRTNARLTAEIEERTRAEEALRHTQLVLTNAQRVGHVGSWEANLATRRSHWSDEFYRILGLEPGKVTPSIKTGLSLIHPEDRDEAQAAFERLLDDGTEFKATLRIVWPDGSIRHILSHAGIIRNEHHRPLLLVGSAADITEQKQAEETLRQLAVHQERIKEEERKRIAREIHDEMGQNLLALRIDVSMLHARVGASHPRLYQKVQTFMDNIDDTIRSVRAVINNLRPVVLDLGLYAAIQWQLNEFGRRSGIACDLSGNPKGLDTKLDDHQTTTLFRILQESLTNVARHAKAKHVHVSLENVRNWLYMKISDDGIGIFPGPSRKPKSFGLMGMKERISAIGGEIRIDSSRGKGTVLLVSIPLKPMAPPAAPSLPNPEIKSARIH